MLDNTETNQPVYPIISEIEELVASLDKVSHEDVSQLDSAQQTLMLDAIALLDPLVDKTQATHSPDYYRALFIAGMPGFEKMSYEAQLVAAQISVYRWRDEHGNDDGASSSQTSSGAVFKSSDVLDMSGEECELDDDLTFDESLPRSLTIVGVDNNVYEIEDDHGIISVWASAFGVMGRKQIAQVNMSKFDNPNFAHLDVVDGIDAWAAEPDFETSIPNTTPNDMKTAACQAFHYVLDHMCGLGSEILMPTGISRVIGASNTANPEKQQKEQQRAEQSDEMQRALVEAKKCGFTEGDLMGAWFRVGKDWNRALEYLKAIYGKDEGGSQDKSPADDADM